MVGPPWSRVMVFSSWICSSSSTSLRVFMVALGTPARPVPGLLGRATLEIVPGIWPLCDGGQGSRSPGNPGIPGLLRQRSASSQPGGVPGHLSLMAAVLRITAWAGHPSSTGKCLVVWQCTPHWPPYTFPSPLPTLRCLAGSPRSHHPSSHCAPWATWLVRPPASTLTTPSFPELRPLPGAALSASASLGNSCV